MDVKDSSLASPARVSDESSPVVRGETALRIRSLTKRFGDQVAVSEVNLEVLEGEFLTLLGPSGCGKTTLLRLISGLVMPSSGSLEFHGTELAQVPPEARPFNLVFQSYALFPHLTVAENVAYGLRVVGLAKEEIYTRVHEALSLVRLSGAAGKKPAELSGGMAQRVALARAIVKEPKVLLLDEPLSALDLKLRREMQLELRELQHRLKTTFVYVTHDQEEAMVMSDRVVLMRDGEVVQQGRPEDVYGAPANRFVAEFIGETNFIPATVEQVSGRRATIAIAPTVALEFSLASLVAPNLGDHVAVAIRPEHVHLIPDATSALTGKVHDVIFHGSKSIATVSLFDEVLLRVVVESHMPTKVGDDVGIRFEEHRGCVVEGTAP